MRASRRTWMALVVGLVAAGCGGSDDAPSKPIRIVYEYRLQRDRDSVSTELRAGSYEVRVEGDCSAHRLVLTKGGVFDDDHDVDRLVEEGLHLEGDGRWRIRQRGGDEMPDCEAVVLYPEGTTPPPAPTTTTTTEPTTTTTTEPPPDIAGLVADWADEHLDSVAQVHGGLTGSINAAGEMFDRGWPDETQALCRAVEERGIGFAGDADEAIDSFPGTVDLAGPWRQLVAETEAVFGRCAGDPAAINNVDAWSVADLELGLAVLQVVGETDPDVSIGHPLVVAYDETREEYREAKRSELMTTALINKAGG